MHDVITFQGITVVSFVSGDLREVIRAWEENRINEADFAMPGCCSRFHRRAGCTTRQRELYFCPRCGHEMRCGKVVHVMGRVCPRCGSIMLKGHGWLRGK